MGKVSLTAVFVWSLLGFAGCSAIAGLDSIQEDNCAPNCGDAAMVVDSRAPTDSSMQADSTQGGDSMTATDTSTPEDSGMVTDTGSGGQDSGVIDTGSVSDAPPIDDAPFDSACGNLNTTSNCGACGAACAAAGTDHETAANCCTGTTCPGSTNGAGDNCSYTCSSGYLDCNASTMVPNNDGCECHAPGATASQCCAGGNCPIQHDYDEDVVGATFYDCVAAGAYNSTDAMDACEAYAGVGQCDVMHSGYYCTYPDGGLAGDMVCSDGTGAPACACWGYDGVMKGYLLIGPGTYGANENNCMCPGPGNPQWD